MDAKTRKEIREASDTSYFDRAGLSWRPNSEHRRDKTWQMIR